MIQRGIPGLIAFPRGWRLERDGVSVRLPPQAWRLAFALCAAAPNSLSRDEAFTSIWGDPADGGPISADKVTEVLVCAIRKALARLGVSVPRCQKGYSHYRAIDARTEFGCLTAPVPRPFLGVSSQTGRGLTVPASFSEQRAFHRDYARAGRKSDAGL